MDGRCLAHYGCNWWCFMMWSWHESQLMQYIINIIWTFVLVLFTLYMDFGTFSPPLNNSPCSWGATKGSLCPFLGVEYQHRKVTFLCIERQSGFLHVVGQGELAPTVVFSPLHMKHLKAPSPIPRIWASNNPTWFTFVSQSHPWTWQKGAISK
jgi:hypothetical protein